jgi:integrase
MLDEFRAFLEVERQLAPKTVYNHVRYIRKLIEKTEEAGLSQIRDFMRGYMGGSVSGYSNALKAVKVFFRDFLGREELVEGFRFPATPFKPRRVPSREELRAFYDEIPTIEGRLYFLLYATSGLRRKEGLSLRPEDVDEGMRMLTPNKGLGGTKNTWVTFYNDEMEALLGQFTPKLGKRWIPIKTDDYRDVWRIPKEKTGISVTPQVLRDLFCVAMGEAGVQDRYVDAFCGRLPKTILAKHYTDYSPNRLKRIYNKAQLKILR